MSRNKTQGRYAGCWKGKHVRTRLVTYRKRYWPMLGRSVAVIPSNVQAWSAINNQR